MYDLLALSENLHAAKADHYMYIAAEGLMDPPVRIDVCHQLRQVHAPTDIRLLWASHGMCLRPRSDKLHTPTTEALRYHRSVTLAVATDDVSAYYTAV